MEYQDYYAILGVSQAATEQEIRSAYRKLARQHHPDVNPGDTEAEERFKVINEAYEVLSDPEKRRRYDQVGSRWREYEQWERAQAAGARSQPFDWQDSAGVPDGGRYEYRTVSEEDLEDLFGETSPFSEFFETFFRSSGGGVGNSGRGGRTARPRPGADITHPLEVSLSDAYRGKTVLLTLSDPSGEPRRLEVEIPPGVTDGSRVRVAGQGQPGRNEGPAGDLYLVIRVRPDPRFERRGDDLYVTVNAPLATFLLGGNTRVPTPDGRNLELSIPEHTPDGRVFRLRRQGMPSLGRRERRGDLHAEVHVQLPERLTERQRELIEDFRQVNADREQGVGSR